MAISKSKKRTSRLKKETWIKTFVSKYIIEIYIFAIFAISYLKLGYINEISKELFIIPIFYYYFSENKKTSLLMILPIAILKDFLEVNLLGVNIFILTSITFFITYQHSINFDKKLSYLLTFLGSTIYIFGKYILLSIIGHPVNITSILHSILLNIILAPLIIKIIEKTRRKID